MKRFRPYNHSLENFVYLIEKKLTHLEHIEDAIFDDGYAGGIEALRMMNGIINTLQGNSKKGVNVQSKVDGSPSIIAGINPENKKFFVATKALFNKTPKINYTPADIDKNHGHAKPLANKMKIALKHFPKLGISGIVQGDFMFLPSDLTKETIDDSDYITFRPNTITYAVPTDDPFAKVIKTAKVGVIWHTSYTGSTIEDLTAQFKVDVGAMSKTKDVWAGDTDFNDVSGLATLTKSELTAVRLELKKAEASLKKLSKKAMAVLFVDSKVDDTIAFNVKIYINDMVSQGKQYSNKQKAIGGFIDFVRKRYQPKIDKLKSAKGKAKKQAVLDGMIKTLNSDRNIGGTFAYALEWHNNVAEIKLALIKKMEQVNSIRAFNKTATGYEVTGPEGFVAVDHLTNSAVKLVNRLEFSRNNFNAIKNWGN
tara:strand:+ start:10769 stop:12040 length:1272 start_codon:yes stop_codon:yes gene_type:complete